MDRYITELLNESGDIAEQDMSMIKARVMASKRTKSITYRSINPDISIHSIYTSETIVEDDLRTAFTRLRLSSHRLRIETGRWAGIAPADRICQCGVSIQSEQHVLCDCTLVNDIRMAYGSEVIVFNDFITTAKF